MEEYRGKVKIGIIGGSGLYSSGDTTVSTQISVDTPYGKPSDKIHITTVNNHYIAFLSRHGDGHTLNPSEVNYRANIAALKYLGCKIIVAFSAVGSLQEEIKPTHFVLPSQVIDRSKGTRKSTFYEDGIVCHAPFADPFDNALINLLFDNFNGFNRVSWHKNKTLVCMEGPQFSTRAESNIYRSWGGDIINMSCVPESKLAREAEIAYVMICMSTDYDCWRVTPDAEDVTVEAVMKTMKQNGNNAKAIIKEMIPFLIKELGSSKATPLLKSLQQLSGSMKFSCCTAKEKRNPETIKKLEFILPGYF